MLERLSWVALASVSACSDGGKPPSGVVEPEPVIARDCLGDGIRCETPEILPLEPGELVTCTETDAGELRVRWRHEVAELDCFAGRCAIAFDGVWSGPDGSVWATAGIYAPGSGGERLESTPIADALFVYDSGGRPRATVVEPRTWLAQPAEPAPTFLAFDGAGHAVRLSKAPGTAALQLTSYDVDGARIAVHRIVEGAAIPSGLAVGPEGFVVAHRSDVVEPGESPPVVTRQSGLARFDSALNGLWNQPALPPGVITSQALAVPDAAGSTLVVEGPPSPGGVPPTWLVHVGASGSLEWVRDAGEGRPKMLPLPAGGAVLFDVYARDGFTRVLQRAGHGGRGLWQLEVTDLDLLPDRLGAVDEAGRIALVRSSMEGPTSIQLVSADGRSCLRHRIALELCLAVDTYNLCAIPALAFGGDRSLAFVALNTIGVAEIGALP